MDDYNIISQKSQTILKRIEERAVYKNKLLPYIKKLYEGDYGDNKIITRSENRYINFENCATDLWIDEESGQITGANFCKQRLCPVCNYRRSTMLWHKVSNVISDIQNEKLLITLTVKNCTGDNLKATIDGILESFHRLTSRRMWKKNIVGFIRGLEITYNSQEDTFHPHIHILAVASENYFKEDYIDVHTLRKWWTESARLDYYVQVDIRKIKTTDKAVAEVVKYAVKMADILQQDADEKRLRATQTLASCIVGRRLISTGGLIKKLAKQKNICIDDEIDLSEKRENSAYYHLENGKYTKKNI